MITIKENEITIEEYLHLRKRVNWRELNDIQAKFALKRSLIVVGAYDGERLVGMGRVVGDGVVICYIQDLVVDPDYQKQHIGSQILDYLVQFVECIRIEGTQMMLCLMCAKGREHFYLEHGFMARPNENLGPGMIRYLRDDE